MRNNFIKCDIFENPHSAPISDTVRFVEVSIIFARTRRCSIIQRWGGAPNTLLNSFLNDVSERLVFEASSSIEMSRKIWE